MTVILLIHRPTLFWENVQLCFLRHSVPGESMTEILFPSRLSSVNSYHSLIICCIVTNNSCIKKPAIYNESLEL